jgi:hypothetical protein
MDENNASNSFPIPALTSASVDPSAAQEDALERTLVSARFGIGELYGHSFVDLSAEERKELASFKPGKDSRVNKVDRDRLNTLREKKAAGLVLSADECSQLDALRLKRDSKVSQNKGQITRLNQLEAKLARNNPLTPREQIRFEHLTQKVKIELESNKPCPFKTSTHQAICTKEGGICSLRLYRQVNGQIVPVPEDDPDGQGGIRATCPNRFHEKHTIFRWAGKELLNQENPSLATEVGFLESEGTVDSSEGEDVGRIDMILVDRTKPVDYPMPWAALEIQAVYFSGKGMGTEFAAIVKNVEEGGTGLIWPTAVRRPDYRSSGPKRLMPQLQTKVPTLRRWGKKMAVVVDRSFYRSMGTMKTVDHASNSDIAWFIVDFKPAEGQNRMEINPGEVFYTTLEESVLGLTGGKPVSKGTFEGRIAAALKQRT